MKTVLGAAAITAASLIAGAANASTISYSGWLNDGVSVTGSVSTLGSYGSSSSGLSDYWSFSGLAGDLVTLTGARLE